MRLIRLQEYETATMELARPIYDKYHRVLLAEGRTIHPAFVQKLQKLNFQYVFVEDSISQGITMEEMIDMPTWIDCITQVQDAFEKVGREGELPLRQLLQTANQLVDEVYSRGAIVLIPVTFLAEELHVYAHSVNVALLSIQLGKKKNYNRVKAGDLALGALVHDLGKVLSKTPDEHPEAGFHYLRGIKEISLMTAHMAFQHHEHEDGSGYPRGVKGPFIHEFAQICGIANLYDHLISENYYPPHIALEFIMTKAGSWFSTELVKLFVQEVPFYPPGTKVKLNTKEEAIVTKIHKNMQRPYVRLIHNNMELALVNNPSIIISKVMVEQEKILNTYLKELGHE
ncbi:HD-GYP domain-containing protein [Bacillus testis]|uniref:HD-GYP domain-containing protein n=1 Tax=Bacillus testis TaxID=1622072 RepID=UPI00067F03FD|nr:HD domain-containing phosphohydrolase [Bacillus testis]